MNYLHVWCVRRWLVSCLVLLSVVLISAYGLRFWHTTPVAPLRPANLDTVIMQPGDLPADITVQLGSIPAYVQAFDPPAADQQAVQLLETAYPGTGRGAVVVFRYASVATRAQAYQKLTDLPFFARPFIPVASVPSLGEQNQLAGPNSLGSVFVVFQRCDAVVFFIYDLAPLYNTSLDMTRFLHYAQQLDTRLQQAVCMER